MTASPAAAGGAGGELAAFIHAAPTPWHAARQAADALAAAGFTGLDPAATWPEAPEEAFVVRDGSLVAWRWPTGVGVPEDGLRLIGAHTDSPTLRIRPRPDTGSAGFRQLAVEVYGGALVNSWLDRDLTLAGRVAVADPDAPTGVSVRLFHHPGPLLRVPQLAIHLDRGVNDTGLRLDRQRHLTPVWGLGGPDSGSFVAWLAATVGVDEDAVVGFDAACADTAPPVVLGADGELLSAPRLDNLASCFGGVEALLRGGGAPRPCVVVLFDHEEVGSTSPTGAVGAWLAQVLERLAASRGLDRAGFLGLLARSGLLSADMAHATHPNYPERHDPLHRVRAGGGPAIKHNVDQRYATEARGAGRFRLACRRAGVPVQDYSHRGDLPCGTTIGPLVAAGLALDTVDVGAPMLSMHSCRELMAVADVEWMLAAFTAWFADDG